MDQLNPLQQIRNLDTTSPQFHEQLSGYLREKEFQGAVGNLQGEDLTWFVEYLDGVSLQTISPHSTLNTGVDACRYFRFYNCHIPGFVAPTRRDMRR